VHRPVEPPCGKPIKAAGVASKNEHGKTLLVEDVNLTTKTGEELQSFASSPIAYLVHGFRARSWLILTGAGKTVFEQRQNHFDKGFGAGFVVVHFSGTRLGGHPVLPPWTT
jgi:hypothetical protein